VTGIIDRLPLQRLPVRWRLAIASAALTLAILIVFAAVVGRLATNRLHSDFDSQLRSAANALAVQIQVSESPGLGPIVQSPRLEDYALANNAAIRIVGRSGEVLAQTEEAPDMGTPRSGLSRRAGLAIANAPVLSGNDTPTAFVQYARSREDLETTIGRVWLFLIAGVFGGTLLATLAGLAVADRAMKPISSLTATAREISETGDPSRRMPEPQTEDEVAELAETLQEMLRSLEASRTETQRAMQVQRDFLADASHELRTPLTSVLANLELLQAALEREPRGEEREIVDSALRSSRRMSRLVSDLLLLARADAGRVSQRRPCDLASVTSEAVAELEPMLAGHRVNLDAEKAVTVEGNPDELHRMTANLLENAIRHTPNGTNVHVSVRTRNGHAELDVSDDGPGLPTGMEERIFARFVRTGAPADTAADGGTGLGLAIVKAVATSHGGDVEAGASPQGGARFAVWIPLAAAEKTKEQLPAL
jgi:two-component system OmpR family sensor kinase